METFGWAIKQMHDGHKVRRPSWNGKGMWIAYTNTAEIADVGFTLPFFT